jgi:hypothetical protein
MAGRTRIVSSLRDNPLDHWFIEAIQGEFCFFFRIFQIVSKNDGLDHHGVLEVIVPIDLAVTDLEDRQIRLFVLTPQLGRAAAGLDGHSTVVICTDNSVCTTKVAGFDNELLKYCIDQFLDTFDPTVGAGERSVPGHAKLNVGSEKTEKDTLIGIVQGCVVPMYSFITIFATHFVSCVR